MTSKYQVGDRVRIQFDSLNDVILSGEIVNINDFREPGLRYAIDVHPFDDVFFVGDKHIIGKAKDS